MLSALYAKITPTIKVGVKFLKYFVDSTFRDKVSPVPGSVLYCDLFFAVEHSGIYVGDGKISNIVVDGIAQSTVRLSSPRSFTSKSLLGRKIYVSCDASGAVGHHAVADGADKHVGEKCFYGLVFKNCHQFSSKCVHYAGDAVQPRSWFSRVFDTDTESWEPTIASLKRAARTKLGARKWKLWDWDNDIRDNPPPEPDWQAHEDHFRHLQLNAESVEYIRAELAATNEYETEIADENIPAPIKARISSFRHTLDTVVQTYEGVKEFLARCPGAQFSYADIMACRDDFKALAQLLEDNAAIKALAHKMGRAYISEEKKRQTRIPVASKSEVHGTHHSADLQRLLPSELTKLEDEELEMLFYAGLLEHNLQTYELSGIDYRNGEETEANRKRTGPVVACLDTSGSMDGKPLLKAKALLLAIANILQKEDRSLHVVLFGSTGEIREYAMLDASNASGLLLFLQQGFGGGTDFETPLKHALALISHQEAYLKADVLMISDGDCALSSTCAEFIKQEKSRLDCSVYSVLCNGKRVDDNFSDEVVVL